MENYLIKNRLKLHNDEKYTLYLLQIAKNENADQIRWIGTTVGNLLKQWERKQTIIPQNSDPWTGNKQN